jgi:UDP-N-acetylmuramate--alanine ligase
VRALRGADEIVLTDIYAAGEPPIPGVSAGGLASALAAAGARVRLVPALDDVAPAVADLAQPGDLVVTLGAGSIGAVGDRILAALRAREPREGGRPCA